MTARPNIPLAATRIGDKLKHDTTINQINRTASSVFRFEREVFPPIEGVTSQRAALIYDWMMTLFKQRTLTDDEKRRTVREFLINVSPEHVRPEVLRILVETNILPSEPADAKPQATSTRAAETALLALVFKPDDLKTIGLGQDIQDVLCARIDEARACIDAGAYLAAVILAGSVLEGLCFSYGVSHPQRVNSAFSALRKTKPPEFDKWKLADWLDVLEACRDLSPNVKQFGHGVRNFRNYVHPREQLKSGFQPDRHTARIAYQVVVAAIEDLANAARHQSRGAV